MPTETIVVVAAITLLFAVFVGTLAWATIYTRAYRAPDAK
jgi:hypothetical protein